jgi:hypothetical protein
VGDNGGERPAVVSMGGGEVMGGCGCGGFGC